ncbi:hypothetical protein HYX70_03105 [Candidatus Saccharibacteria bacterium]|nr:hypothetical protein [Candidatus Saccharibacteria bacterium]
MPNDDTPKAASEEVTTEDKLAALAEDSELDRADLIRALRQTADLLEQLEVDVAEPADLDNPRVRQVLMAEVQELTGRKPSRQPSPDHPDPTRHPSAHMPEGTGKPADPGSLKRLRNRIANEEVAQRMFDDKPDPPVAS